VAALTLDDIDWKRERLGVPERKAGHSTAFPLATTVGEAIVDYLQHSARRVSPHIFRHTAAVHLLEAGVEVNVIRGWLGHADLTTTNRYAEITTKTKLAALRASGLSDTTEASRTKPIWRTDESLLNWLASL
jgi:integrase